MARVKALLTKPFVVMPLLAVVVLAGWAVFQAHSSSSDAAAQPTDQTVAVTSGTIAETVSGQGTVASSQSADLNFGSSGTVTAVNVKAGQKVSAGDVLAQIDSTSLQAALSTAQSSEAQAEAKLSDDESAGASAAQLTADQTSVTTAQDKVATAYTALGGAQLVAAFDGTVSQVNLTVGEQLGSSGTGGTNTSGSQSPSGGSTSALGSSSTNGSSSGNGSSGGNGSNSTGGSNTGSSSTPELQVITASSFTVQLGFDASDVAKIADAQPATIQLSTTSSNTSGFPGGGFAGGGGFPGGGGFAGGGSAGGGTQGGNSTSSNGTTNTVTGASSATGTVTDVGTVATVSSGVAKYPVTVTFSDDTGTFNPGATVVARITYAEKQNALQVPAAAVTTTNGVSTVTVNDNGSKQTQTVTTGLTSGNMVEITSGLQAGDQVVISFPSFQFGGNRGTTAGGSGSTARTGTGTRGGEGGQNSSAVIELVGVTKTYRSGSLEVEALHGIDMRVDEGEFVAIVGPSGSGKSTLMHIVGCLDVPSTGQLLLAGQDVADFDEDRLADVRNRYIGFVFQQFNLLPYMTAVRNVELPLVYAGVEPAKRRELARASLELVGLAERGEHRPGELSGGQQQRVAIARALVTEPALLLADEPTGNLDAASTRDILNLLTDLHRAGRTIVLITHEASVAARASRVVHLFDGHIADDEDALAGAGPTS